MTKEDSIGIDARALRSGPAGIATYVRNLLARIPELQPVDQARPGNNFLWNQTRPPWGQLRNRWRVYHAASYTAPLVNFSKLVLFVPDISYLAESRWYPYKIDGLRRWYYVQSLKAADRIIVSSDFTRRELSRVYPDLSDRIRRTYLGVSPEFRKDELLAAQVRSELGLPDRFVLHVGDLHPRRNLRTLKNAARRVGIPLVLVGKVLQGGEEFRDDPLRFSGLTLSQLVGVYSAATLLAYPSSYEGFGFPLVEAMASRLPIVASTRSCIPEVCGDAAVLVEPEVGDIEQGIRKALGRAENLIERGLRRVERFTWENTVEETRKVYSELV